MSDPETKEYIPKEYHDLLEESQKTTLAESSKRMRQASSALIASTPSDFLAAKIDALESEVYHIEDCKSVVHGLSRLRRLPPIVASESLKNLARASTPLNEERRVIKRQKKAVQDDMQDAMPEYNQLGSAYADAMVAKVASAAGNQPKVKFKANDFRIAVENFYEASRMDVTITIDDPRNGLMLDKRIATAMDTGNVVIVPVGPPADEESIEWKILVTDSALRKHVAADGVKWNAIHGKTLTFLGRKRPAKRYLYFRYIMTYLMLKNKGRLDWVQEVETGGCMWATPGKYLRRSMLINLARRVSNCYLPEVFYKTSTFDNTDPDVTADSPDSEEFLTINLANSILTTSATLTDQNEENEVEDEDESVEEVDE
ncbi:hypothetical protein FQN49_007651 [Arthroderma sp. PD_2]|nr:hypothetical protein FQN49_007651 [Arthroderma sp. PD_2]